MPLSARATGTLAGLAAITLWGVSFVATKVALRDVSPLTLIVTRFALGVVALHALLAWRRESLLPPRAAMKWLALMGLIGVAAHQLLQATALTMTSAISTGWLIGLTPAWSALLAAIFLRERLSRMRVAGLLVAMAGALVVVLSSVDGRPALSGATRGDLLVLISTVTWAVFTIISRDAARDIGALRTTAGTLLAGWLMILPIFLARADASEWGRLGPAGWAAILFLGVGCSGAGYLLWQLALERLDATRVAAFLYLEPLVTLVAAVLVLGEAISLLAMLGGALVLAGVAIVQQVARPSPRRRREGEPA